MSRYKNHIMLSSYWLEMWVPKSAKAKVNRYLRLPTQNMRSIVRLFEEHRQDEPSLFSINQLLDQWEVILPDLEAKGVRRKDFSLWLGGKYDKSFDLQIDAMSLLRMGQEQLKLCISCERSDPAEWDTMDPDLFSKSVDIKDIWAETDIDLSLPYTRSIVPVSVSFDDGTFWQARFVPYSLLSNQDTIKNGFFWEPDMVLVPFVNQLQIEKTVLELMRQQKFERAFSNLEEGVGEREEGQSIFELQIIHENLQALPIAEILTVPDSNVVCDHRFWKLRNVQQHGQAGFDYLHYYQELLEKHFPKLRKLGIRRQDISINYDYRYEENCNLELQADSLHRLGRNGISLHLQISQAAKAVARNIE